MKTNIPKFKHDFENLIPFIQHYNNGITHDDFVSGVKNKILGIKVMKGEPYQFIPTKFKLMFYLLVLSYTIIPIVVIPVLAYYFNNWWLVFGIFVSYLFSFLAAWRKSENFKWLANIIVIFAVFSLYCWIKTGFHIESYGTFFFFCGLWGNSLFLIAETTQKEHALNVFISNKAMFEYAIKNHLIMIVHKSNKYDEDIM